MPLMQGKEQLRRYLQDKLRIDQDPPPPSSLPDGKGPPKGSGWAEEGKGGDGASGEKGPLGGRSSRLKGQAKRVAHPVDCP